MGTTTAASPASPLAYRNPILAWLFSSIGKKTIVALTGIGLILFVTGHLAGNLTFFFGPDVMNAYAMHLESLGPFLWVIRLGLLAIVGLHIIFTMLLWKENQTARPNKYLHQSTVQTTVFARTMRLSGLLILAFVVFHIAHFTARIVFPSYNQLHATLDGKEVRDVHRMVVIGFSHPVVSAFYVISLALLASHLSHGIASLFQTLGISNMTLRPVFEKAGLAIAWLLFIGFSAIPVSILIFGFGR
jgi:succinate dehydrogenase / fumarate reductase cytochrome b subunit